MHVISEQDSSIRGRVCESESDSACYNPVMAQLHYTLLCRQRASIKGLKNKSGGKSRQCVPPSLFLNNKPAYERQAELH